MIQKTDNLLAFAVYSLRLNEMVYVAQYALDNDILDLEQVRTADIILGSVKSISFEKTFYQVRKRVKTLTPAQVEILAHGDLISQKQIAFLSVCKCYSFIKEFAIEVIREKILLYDYQLNETDFKSFVKNKTQEYPQLEKYRTSTFDKAKQVLFLMLEQAGIIDNIKDKRIQPQLLSTIVMKAIAEEDRNLLKIYLLSDRDIKEFKY
jgi:hypothetical protein